MNNIISKNQKLYLLALRKKLAKTEDKVFNLGNEYKNNKVKSCRAGKMGDGILPAKVRNGQGGKKMVEVSITTPRTPETDGVSGRTFAKVRGRFSRSLVNRKTTRGKRAGRWRAVVWPHLHIDDGSMGGGGPIPHEDYLTEDMEDFLYDNDGLDGTGGYGFTPGRKDIFHYCIFAHKGAKESSKDNPDGDTGEGERGGDEFQVFDALNGLWFSNKEDDQAKSFMHELGHNLDLGHNSTKKSVMYKYPLEAENIDYTSGEWSTIDLSGSFN